jgi:Sec-independent protein translocase protein TatA
MNTVTLLIVMFVLVLVLGLQIQMTQTNKKLDAFLKRMENFMGDAMKYVSAKNHLN